MEKCPMIHNAMGVVGRGDLVVRIGHREECP